MSGSVKGLKDVQWGYRRPDMRKCQQCGRPATIRITNTEGELYLCIDCNLKLEQAEALEFHRTAQQFNMVAGAFEAAAGLPGLVPRVRIPPAPPVPIANMNVNNFNVNNSVLGVLNTGSIQSVDNAITVLRQSGVNEMASAISKLTQAVIDAKDIGGDLRNRIVETLSFIAEEAAKPETERRPAGIRPLITDLATSFSGLAGLSVLWQEYGPVIQSFFS